MLRPAEPLAVSSRLARDLSAAMDILQLNNYHYVRGGSERIYFETAGLLERHGHRVSFFSVRHPLNQPCPEDRFFGEEFDPASSRGLGGRLGAALRMIHSRPNNRSLARLLAEVPVDVAHAHNIYGRVCPSVFRVLRQKGIPILLTLHDYKLCCPVYTCYRDRQVCTECLERGPFAVVRNRCTKGSLAASLVHYGEHRAHRLLGYYTREVSFLLCPSQFLLERHLEAGFPVEKLVHLPYPLRVEGIEPRFDHDGYVLYAGRLSYEKGVEVLLDAFQGLDLRLLVVGDGPMRPTLEERARSRGQQNVQFKGHLVGADLVAAFRGAALNVVPSRWFENQPLSILESFAYGTPVVASDLGALPELVVEGETGSLFPPGDAGALRERLRYLLDHESQRQELGRGARARVERVFDVDVHYERLHELYERALAG